MLTPEKHPQKLMLRLFIQALIVICLPAVAKYAFPKRGESEGGGK